MNVTRIYLDPCATGIELRVPLDDGRTLVVILAEDELAICHRRWMELAKPTEVARA